MQSENTQLTATLRSKILSFLPADLPVTGLEGEKVLLARVADASNQNPIETFWQLVHFYRIAEKNDLACKLINHMLAADDSAENRAHCYLVLGQIAEVREQFDAAIDFYTRGLTFRTPDKIVKYFLYNNTAYCLNVQEKYRAAENYCRWAIYINPARANAFKNLGISLAAQNNPVGAAWAYVEAMQAEPGDLRAFHLLKTLVVGHPELGPQFALLLNNDEPEHTKEN